MEQAVRRIAAPLRALMRICAISAMLLLSAVSLVTVYDVLSRKLMDAPLFGVPEIIEMTMLFVCFLTIGYIGYRREEIEIDFFNPRLPPLGKRLMEALRLLVCLFVFGMIVWQSFVQGLAVMENDEISMSLRMPLWPFYFVITFGSTLYCLELLFQLILGTADGEVRGRDAVDPLS